MVHFANSLGKGGRTTFAILSGSNDRTTTGQALGRQAVHSRNLLTRLYFGDRTTCPVWTGQRFLPDRTDNTPSLEGCLSGVRLNRLAKVVTK